MGIADILISSFYMKFEFDCPIGFWGEDMFKQGEDFWKSWQWRNLIDLDQGHSKVIEWPWPKAHAYLHVLIISPTEGDGDILFLVWILLALASAFWRDTFLYAQCLMNRWMDFN